MRPQKSFTGQPIRDLQTMLRVIAKHKGHPTPLVPDGIYGPATMKQVSEFQRSKGLPPTGSADRETWEAILLEYGPAKVNLRPAESLQIVLNPGTVIESGQENPHVYLIQSMLEVMYRRYKSVKSPGFSGILDQKTENSLKSFQTLAGLASTGKLDKLTWKYLVLQYPLAADGYLPQK